MNGRDQSEKPSRKPSRLSSCFNSGRAQGKTLAVIAFVVGTALCGSARAVDSFFDIFVDTWDSGLVVMTPDESGVAYPFPPPPLNFPDIPTATGALIDIELVSLSLQGSQPMVVSAPDPTSNHFTVDSFFDIFYELRITDSAGNSEFVVDSFFDVFFSIEVIPGRFDPNVGDYDVELIDIGASEIHTIPVPGPAIPGVEREEIGFAVQLFEGLPQGIDGHVTVLKLAGGGGAGGFAVDSFFDVFVEISIDGGNSLVSPIENTPLRMLSQTQVTVPEPSTLVLLALAVLGTTLASRRRSD